MFRSNLYEESSLFLNRFHKFAAPILKLFTLKIINIELIFFCM